MKLRSAAPELGVATSFLRRRRSSARDRKLELVGGDGVGVGSAEKCYLQNLEHTGQKGYR